MNDQDRQGVEALRQALIAKIDNSLPLLCKSLGHGRLVWRRSKSGVLEVRLEISL